MGHRDRWRTAALIAATAGLVVQPAIAVPFVATAWALSSRQRPPMALGATLAAAIVLGLVAIATSSMPATWLLALVVVALGPAASLWSSIARAGDAGAVAMGLAAGMLAQLVYAAGTGQTPPIAGMTAHPNVLGALGAVSLPLLAVTALLERGAAAWFARLGGVAALAAMAAAGSRGALVTGLVALAWWIVLVARARAGGPRRAGFGVAVAFLGVAGVLVLAWIGVRQPTWTEAFATTGRTTLWGVAIEAIVERPVLGHGALAWARVAPTIEPSIGAARFPHAHSGYLELALSFGLVGLGAALAFFGALYRALGAANAWRAAAQATLVAFAIANVGEAFVVDARFLGIVVLVSGAAWARGEPPLTPRAPTPRRPTS